MRRKIHLASPRIDIIATDYHLALQHGAKLKLQQTCRPATLVARANNQQPPLDVYL